MSRFAEIRRLGTVAILSLLVSGCGGCSSSSLGGGASNVAGGETDANSAANGREGGGPTPSDDIYKRIDGLPKDARNYEERDSYKLSDKHLAALKVHRAIEELDIGGCPNTTDAGIAEATANRDLKAAVLSNTGAIELLRRWASVPTSDGRISGACDRVTDAGLAKLALASGLEEPDLSGCVGVTDLGLASAGLAQEPAHPRSFLVRQIVGCGDSGNPFVGAMASAALEPHTSVSDKALEGLTKSATLNLSRCAIALRSRRTV